MSDNLMIFKLFVNALMKEGKHIRALHTFASALEIIKRRKGKNPYTVVIMAINLVKPFFELKSRKVAASRYKIPYLLKPEREYVYAARFILKNAEKRSEKTREERLAGELMDASAMRGRAFKQKKSLYRDVVLNRTYLKFMK